MKRGQSWRQGRTQYDVPRTTKITHGWAILPVFETDRWKEGSIEPNVKELKVVVLSRFRFKKNLAADWRRSNDCRPWPTEEDRMIVLSRTAITLYINFG